jgi:hypothetical protein
MARFAIFYTREDFTAIAAEATNPGLTPQEKQYATALWNRGLNAWSTASTAPEAQSCVNIPFQPSNLNPTQTATQNPDGSWKLCDSDIRVCVVDGVNVSKQQTIDWLRLIGNKYPGALYMLAIADDIESTAVEPWP